jgi:catechol 2,3-dioxygenase-like lactoylglutathione lyase family enzyme
MSRFHVHVRVADVEKSIRFYETLFGVAPDVVKPDYAKWMLDDPKVNFAISAGCGAKGIDHLGIQVEADPQLRVLASRLRSAGEKTRDEEAVTCCYAKGNKSWVNDPSGVRWETFFTFGDATTYGEPADASQSAASAPTACST